MSPQLNHSNSREYKSYKQLNCERIQFNSTQFCQLTVLFVRQTETKSEFTIFQRIS